MTRLRAERLSRGLTLRELAPLVGTTFQNLAYLERGETKNPRPGLRFRLEKFFGLPVEALTAPLSDNRSDPADESTGPLEFATTRSTHPGADQSGASDEV